MIEQSLSQASLAGLLGLLISVVPLVMGVMFAIRPDERRLALMRPLSLAGIFASICTMLSGIANGLQSVSMAEALDISTFRLAAVVLSESVVPAFLGFGFLTLAWLSVAVGMRKSSS